MPGTTPGPFTELWAFVSDEGDREGILAQIMPGLGSTLFVSGDPRIIKQLRPIAQRTAIATGRKIKLVRFVRADEEPL